MKIFTARHIFDGNSLLKDHAILVDNGIIVGLVPSDQVSLQNITKDYGDNIITPGFIDLQINGCGGVLFNNNPDFNTLDTIYQTCLRYATTSYLPTLITCDFEQVINSLNAIKDWFSKYGDQRGVLGIHLEGPFIATGKKGIHPEKYIIKPNDYLLARIVSYRKFFPIKMTIAIEEFTLQQIKFLIDNRITLSIGHSNASFEQAKTAIEQGVITATHAFNAMSGLTARNPGVIGAILSHNIYTGIIADMLHVNGANIKLLYDIKPDFNYLVTDAVTPMGTNISQFVFAEKTLYVKNRQCLDENGILGGAYLTMLEAVANCVRYCAIPVEQALKMATSIPAKVLGYDHALGYIAPGYRSNIVAINLFTLQCEIIQ